MRIWGVYGTILETNESEVFVRCVFVQNKANKIKFIQKLLYSFNSFKKFKVCIGCALLNVNILICYIFSLSLCFSNPFTLAT